MMVEFVIAAIALTLWVAASDPFVRMMAFNVVVMSTITTVVFNANPLLRYDAYYILCDLIGVDNLATRAQLVINTLTRRAFLGDKRPWPERGVRTSTLFVAYGTASFIYKTMIVIAVLVGIAPRFFIFGLLLAVWGAATMVIIPVYRQVRSVLAFASGDSRKGVLAGLRIGLPIAILALLLALPLPYVIVTAGAIQLPPQSVVRAGGDGFLLALPVGRGATVEVGTPLALLGDDILDAEIESRSASLRAQQLRYDMVVTANLVQAAQLRSEIDVLAAELSQQEANRERLAIAASQPGQFALAENLRIGDFLQEGSEIGLIVPPDADRVVTTSLTQEDADLLRSRILSITVRTLGGDQRAYTAQMLRNYPLFAVPQAGVEPGPTGRFVFELALRDAPLRYAQPVMVRFDLGWAPVAEQIWRTAGIWFNKIAMSRYVEEPI